MDQVWITRLDAGQSVDKGACAVVVVPGSLLIVSKGQPTAPEIASTVQRRFLRDFFVPASWPPGACRYDARVSRIRRLSPAAVALGVALLAFAMAALAHRLGWLPGPAPAAAAATVLVIAFAWRPMDGLLALLVTTLLADSVEVWTATPLRLLDELAIGLFVVAALVVHRRRLDAGSAWPPGIREVGLGLVLACGLASSLVNGVPLDVWLPGAVLLVKGFVLFYLVSAFALRPDELGRGIVAIATVGLVIAAIGFAEFLAPDAVRAALGLPAFEQERGGLTVVKSVFLHPALYGWLTAFLALFAYARFAVLRERWALLLALILTSGTLISGRRTPLLGIGAGLVAGGVRLASAGLLPRRTWLPVAAAVAILVIATLPVTSRFVAATIDEYLPSRELVGELLSPDPDPAALRYMQPRVGLTIGSVAIARDEFPLGAGIGRFGSQMSREIYSPIYARYGMDQMYGIKPEAPIAVTDTFWPMILGETGVIGLLGALAFFGAMAVQLWRAVAVASTPALRAFVLGALLVYVEGLVRTLTSPAFVAPPIAYFILATAGLALAATRPAIAKETRAAVPS